MTKNRNNKGQSMVEFIIAVGLLVIVTGSGAIALLGSLTSNRLAKEHTQASAFAQEGIEAAKSIRNQNWDDLANGTYGIDDSQGFWEFSESPNTLQSKFTRVVTIEDVEEEGEIQPYIKKITSKVSWDYSPTRPNQVDFVTYLTNWQTVRAAMEGGYIYGTCNDYCVSIGFNSGTCSENPTKCENYIPYGDQYCMGGPSEDTCCCSN